MSYSAYVLDEGSRSKLLAQLPPKYPDVIAHHVTIDFGVKKSIDAVLIGTKQPIQIIGYVNGDGIEAAIVAVAGNTTRPDGKVFHITLSLDRSKGHKPVDSNALIKENGWIQIQPFTVLTKFDVLN